MNEMYIPVSHNVYYTVTKENYRDLLEYTGKDRLSASEIRGLLHDIIRDTIDDIIS